MKALQTMDDKETVKETQINLSVRAQNNASQRRDDAGERRESHHLGQKEEMNEETLIPPDGGWGWIVTFGGIVILMLSPLIGTCFTILFLHFLLDLGTSSTVIAWIYNLQNCIFNIVGLMVGPLTAEFGAQRIAAVGAALTSASLMISAFANSSEFLFFSFSILAGLGSGFTVPTAMLILPKYFDKKRGRANSMLMAGLCIGQMVCPILSEYLVDTYGFRIGAFLAGAVLMNGFVAASLFPPVEWHAGERTVMNRYKENSERNLTVNNHDSSSNEMEKMLNSGQRQYDKSLQLLESSTEKSPSQFQNSTYHCTKLNRESIESRYNQFAVSTLFKTLRNIMKRTVENMEIMKSPQALIIAVSNTIFINGYINFLLMIPFAMQEAGHSLENSAWCFSVSGICNLITRIIVNVLADHPRFDIKMVYKIGLATVAVAIFAFPLLHNIQWLIVIMGLWGCGIGATAGVYTIIMIKVLGPEKLPACFGSTCLFIGIGYITVAPIMGYVRDLSSSYLISMWVSAGFVTVSLILWLFMPCASAYDKRKGRGA